MPIHVPECDKNRGKNQGLFIIITALKTIKCSVLLACRLLLVSIMREKQPFLVDTLCAFMVFVLVSVVRDMTFDSVT